MVFAAVVYADEGADSEMQAVMQEHAAVYRTSDLLAVMVGGDTTHVVVDGGQDGDGFLGHIDTGEDGGRLTDAGQPLGEKVGGQVVQMQVDVILLGSHTACRELAAELPDGRTVVTQQRGT